MSMIRKLLWGIFVALAGAFSGAMVQKGLKTVYNPSEDKKADPENNETEAEEEPTTTDCAPSVSDTEVEKGEDADEKEKSNEE